MGLDNSQISVPSVEPSVPTLCHCGGRLGHRGRHRGTKLAQIPPSPAPTEQLGGELRLVARSHEQMQQCQGALAEWLRRRIGAERHRWRELKENFAIAKRNKWRSGTLARNTSIAKRTVAYYEKVKAAVDAGYTIIPDFPIDLFAIRVGQSATPALKPYTGAYDRGTAEQSARGLPARQGRYVSDRAARFEHDGGKNEKGEQVRTFYNADFEAVAFPLTAVRPEIMSATAEAMALKLFDTLGICPATRNRDPMVIGTILGPNRGYTRRSASFLIAWFLDTRTL